MTKCQEGSVNKATELHCITNVQSKQKKGDTCHLQLHAACLGVIIEVIHAQDNANGRFQDNCWGHK